MIQLTTLPAPIQSFASDEAGSSTVEAVMWLPLFFFITVFVLDASMMFNTQSRALRIVQDTNRALAVGQIASPEEAEQILQTRMASISPSASRREHTPDCPRHLFTRWGSPSSYVRVQAMVAV